VRKKKGERKEKERKDRKKIEINPERNTLYPII